jgi:hypothetical protein
MAAEIQREERAKHRPWTLVHMDNVKSHTFKCNLAIMEELHLKNIADPPFSPDVAPSDFFLFEWWKGELVFQSVGEISKLFNVIEEILSLLTAEITANVLSNWIERLK